MNFRFILYSAAALLITGCKDMCANEISQLETSPSGTHAAYVFSRNCGATTGFNTQVSVQAAAVAPPQDAGNVYISTRQIPLKLEWQDDHSLKISGVGSVPYVLKASSAGSVKVIYGH